MKVLTAAEMREVDRQTIALGIPGIVLMENAAHRVVYDRLYALYKQLHDAFGVAGTTGDLSRVMKELLAIRDEARRTSHA